MLVFLDFEASSLSDHSYPIEIGWAFEDGRAESHLIRPLPDWTDWNERSEAIHGIPRALIEREGEPVADVAARMVDQLAGHDLLASAPSWDGHWLSVLLRGAGLPRHALSLRDTEAACLEAALAALAGHPDAELQASALLNEHRGRWAQDRPAHRALADAGEERRRWLEIHAAARALAAAQRASA